MIRQRLGTLACLFYFHQPLAPSDQMGLTTLGEIALDIGVELVPTTTGHLNPTDCGYQHSTLERRLKKWGSRVVEEVKKTLEQVVRVWEVNVQRSKLRSKYAHGTN